MAKKTIVIAECDLCGTDIDVRPHELSIDRKAPTVVDACTRCWAERCGIIDELIAAGRSKKVAARLPRVTVRRPALEVTPEPVKKPAKKTTTTPPKKRTSRKDLEAAKA